MTEAPSASPFVTVPLTKSRLSELALKAAIELDRASRAKAIGEAPGTSQFFELLREQLDKDRHRVFKDQTLVPVYALAMSRSAGSSFVPREDLAQLLEGVLEKHDTVEQQGDGTAETRIAFLRDFCLAVHEALVFNLMGHRSTAIKNDERAKYN